MIDKIKKILKSGDEPSEDSSDYDGLLSYAAEWHALVLGGYDGLRKLKPVGNPADCRSDNSDVNEEPHYYGAGYIIGTFLQFCLVAASAIFSHGMI